MEGRAFLKDHQHFKERIRVQISFTENVICNNIKIFEKIGSKEVSRQVYESQKRINSGSNQPEIMGVFQN